MRAAANVSINALDDFPNVDVQIFVDGGIGVVVERAPSPRAPEGAAGRVARVVVPTIKTDLLNQNLLIPVSCIADALPRVATVTKDIFALAGGDASVEEVNITVKLDDQANLLSAAFSKIELLRLTITASELSPDGADGPENPNDPEKDILDFAVDSALAYITEKLVDKPLLELELQNNRTHASLDLLLAARPVDTKVRLNIDGIEAEVRYVNQTGPTVGRFSMEPWQLRNDTLVTILGASSFDFSKPAHSHLESARAYKPTLAISMPACKMQAIIRN